MACGVPAGATMPVSVSASWSGTPASAMVGTSGSAATRSFAITASARTLPSFAAVIAGGSAVNATGVWPPMVEVIAGAAPGNGTIVRSRSNVSLNSSPPRCGVEPSAGCA